ncbi:AAA family ATPase [Methylobacterium sp. sgz302541]|uniref:AAA family ATPase n=1 Tax=unclassified Methylobacterium TaxID=2615210 RepID=UPI003D33BFA0
MNEQMVNNSPSNAQPDDGLPDLKSILDRIDSFAETPTSARILGALDEAHRTSRMTAIAGVPGVGKTTACQRYAQGRHTVWHCQFTSYTRTTYGVLCQIGRALGFYTMPRQPDLLGSEIEYALARSGGLLICDEAQHLTRDGFETVRGIFDAVANLGHPLGVAFVGHTDLMEKVAKLPQLDGRISSPLRITSPAEADVDAILAQCGITDAKVRAFLRQHATHKTGLRRVVAALRNAVVYAASDDIPLKEAHVRQAWAELSGALAK